MGSYTSNLNLYKPAQGEVGWSSLVNQNFDDIDTLLSIIDTGVFRGSGSPEGVITASVGSLYLRTDSRQALYLKTYGSGSTGWTQVRSRMESRIAVEGLLAETWAAIDNSNSLGTTSQRVAGTLMGVHAGDVITNVHIAVTNAGSGFTSAKVGLYSTAGGRLAQSANISGSLGTTGKKTLALTAPYTVTSSGAIYPVFWNDASNTAGLARRNPNVNAIAPIGSNPRLVVQQNSQTDLPTTATWALPSANQGCFWFGVS